MQPDDLELALRRRFQAQKSRELRQVPAFARMARPAPAAAPVLPWPWLRLAAAAAVLLVALGLGAARWVHHPAATAAASGWDQLAGWQAPSDALLYAGETPAEGGPLSAPDTGLPGSVVPAEANGSLTQQEIL